MNQPPEPAPLPQVLIIDDDLEFCALIQEYLSGCGYQVAAAHTGPDGVAMVVAGTWHAVILDVMLPGCDGFEVLRQIRETCGVPVLMLTARGDESDQIAGLEGGADDYLPKGSSTRALLARLHAITRRAARADSEIADEIVIGKLRLNAAARYAALNGTPLALTAGEFEILLSLARAKGRVKTRDELMEEIRDRVWQAFDRSLDVHISNLRRKLGDDPKDPGFIRTVRGVGYMMEDPTAARLSSSRPQ
jgi:DNA-binding response OmpR family regulator